MGCRRPAGVPPVASPHPKRTGTRHPEGSRRHVTDGVCRPARPWSEAVSLEHRPNRVILVRHGESEGNLDDTIYERVTDHQIGLSAKGFQQARLTGALLAKR